MNFTFLLIVVQYIIITYAFGLVYMLAGRKNSEYIQRRFGWTGYCILGSVGVPFHELAHLITAVIFGHKINEVSLFRPSKGKVDGTLGYVKHTWRDGNPYQKIGNFFIGTAPMFFGAGLLFVVLRVTYPTVFTDVAHINEIPGSLLFAFENMFRAENLLTMRSLIVLLITIFICPHMHMSWADVKGATSGAITLIIAAFVFSLASALIPSAIAELIENTLNTFAAYYIYALALGLAVSVIMTICFGLLSLGKVRR